MTADNSSGLVHVDRRTTMKWFMGAVAMGQLAACGDQAGWREMAVIQAKGVGTDIDFNNIAAPWPLTMTQAELVTTNALVDLILPGEGDIPFPSEVGVPALINEWVSAPYPDQHKDRELIIPGLAWVDEQSNKANGVVFAKADPSAQKAILDRIAFKDKVEPGLEKPAQFFAQLRLLTLGAFYTTREGWADIGYQGNTPSVGDYAGPTPEALAHIKGVIERMGLKYTAP